MSEPSGPEIIVIGGPNGAGKSTLARLLIPATVPFLNADQVAERLPGDPSASRDREAARILLAQWDALAARRRSFAVESTLASRSLAPRLRGLRAAGYRVHLCFIASPDPDLNVARVASRVRAGGHDIPEATVRRRFARSRQNLTALYLPLAGRASVFRNDDTSGPALAEIFYDGSAPNAGRSDHALDQLDEVLRRFRVAVREALRDHKRAGNPIAVWRDDRVVLVPPDEITWPPGGQ